MALSFPFTPTVGDIHTAGALSWRWDGVKWVSDGGASSGGGVSNVIAYRDWLAAGNVPDPAPQTQVEVPQTVTRFQARAALHLAGHLSAVESLMANDATPMLARLAWQDALTFERHSPTVAGMAQALGLSGEAIDQLFIVAAQIEA